MVRNRYWVVLTKDADQVIVLVTSTDYTAALAAAQASAPEGYRATDGGLLRKA